MSVSAAEFWFVLAAGFALGAIAMVALFRLDRIVEWLDPDAFAPDDTRYIIPLHYDDSRHVRTVPGAYDQDRDS